MFTGTSLARVILFAGTLALFSWGARQALSQPQWEGGLAPYDVPQAPSGAGALTLTGTGHIDYQAIIRSPSGGWPVRIESDKILFTGDIGGGLGVHIAGGEMHDKWTWLYYDPEGALYSSQCYIQIRNPGEQGNSTPYVALVTNCPGVPGQQWAVLETFASGCPCTSGTVWTLAVPIAGHPPEAETGTWTAFVDYTDPGGVTTPGVAHDDMYLMYTPAVVLMHGYDASCGDLSDTGPEHLGLEQLVEQELAVTPDRVQCFEVEDQNGYDSRKGVKTAAIAMPYFVQDLRASLAMGPDEEVDLVGHSLGGLVARYYYRFWWGANDGPVGSISMLGTPNQGVWVANLEPFTCAFAEAMLGWIPFFGPFAGSACAVVDWRELEEQVLGFDPDSQGVVDAGPGSKILDDLNSNFVLPSYPVYQVHAGLNGSWLGSVMHPFDDGDCVVSVGSAYGPGNIFQDTAVNYPALSHDRVVVGIGPLERNVCDDDTLISSADVASDLAVTIKGEPAGTGSAMAGRAAFDGPDPGIHAPLLASVVDYVLPTEAKTQQIIVPANTGRALFAVFWPGAEVDTDLAFTLRRPDGSVVAPTDPDVIDAVEVTGDSLLGTLVRAFVMNVDAPEARTWEVTIGGATVPDQGQPYLVAFRWPLRCNAEGEGHRGSEWNAHPALSWQTSF
jgi:hypothetical protein